MVKGNGIKGVISRDSLGASTTFDHSVTVAHAGCFWPKLTMSLDDHLIHPAVIPSTDTIMLFWQRISDLTSRTRSYDGQWIGSSEVKAWNAINMQKCEDAQSAGL
ncbi:hypothetical protein B0H13DRAFT_1882592 [Mycena leptocephala]|nr:hypothetical protein B0H13DRAFT_1882592 [Mycena leptocephala]